MVVVEAKRLDEAGLGVPQAIIYMGNFPYIMDHALFIFNTGSSHSPQSPQAGGAHQLADLRHRDRLLGLAFPPPGS